MRRALSRWGTGLAVAVAVALSAWQVIEGQRRLSHTVDEPVHVAAGLEWLQRHTQRLHPENPPLGRAGAGLHARLAGRELPPRGSARQRGMELLYAENAYRGNLTGARRGTVPFYLLLLAVTGGWAFRLGGVASAAIAVVAVASLPGIVAHSALATTDIPFTALLLMAIWRLALWLDSRRSEEPSQEWLWRWASTGLAAGLALAAKFSALLFLPAAGVAMAVARWRGPRRGSRRARSTIVQLTLASLTGLTVLWAAYGFDVGRVVDIRAAQPVIARAFPDDASAARGLAEELASASVPAPGALHGLYFLLAHARAGHPAYLFGDVEPHGFWSYYPVALAVKTPLAFLLLAGVGLVSAWRWGRDWRTRAPAAAAFGVLLAALPSSINIGTRHVLIVYPLIAVTAAVGLVSLARRVAPSHRTVLVSITAVVLGALALGTLSSHPNQLAFFNAFAGSEPGRILLDSDLDWGQGLLELSNELERRDVSRVHIAYFGSASLCDHGLPDAMWLPPGRRVSGWVAVSEMYYRGQWRQSYDEICPRRGSRTYRRRDGYAWLESHRPVAIVGGSIRLYRIDE